MVAGSGLSQLSRPFTVLRLESVLIWMCDLIMGGSLVARQLSSLLPGAHGEDFLAMVGVGGVTRTRPALGCQPRSSVVGW